MRKLCLVAALAAALAGVVATQAQADKLDRQAASYRLRIKQDKKMIVYLTPRVTFDLLRNRQQLVEPFRAKMLSRYIKILSLHERKLAQVRHKIQVRNYWRTVYKLVPHYNDWLCIHHYEGDWEDGGDPYWGGLQMDQTFMHTYGMDMIREYGKPRGFVGPNGWSNAWPPLAQMIVAERAYRSGRGFHPWPNTARSCGLL